MKRRHVVKGRETKRSKNRKKVGVHYTVICFFLIEEDEPPINGVLCCITENIAQGHGNIRSLASLDKASLVMSDQIRKDSGKA